MADISKITAGSTTYNIKDANASRSNHTHTTSIATSTGTSQLTLSANSKYSLTAGGTSYIFTTPPNVDISGKADKASITAGTAGTSSATSGSSLSVPYVTMNAQGIVTGYGTHTHTVSGFASSSHTHSSVVDSGDSTKIVSFGYSKSDYTDAAYIAVWNSNELRTLSRSSVCSLIDAVPNTRTINSKALSSNITLSASDVGASASDHTHTTTIAQSSGTSQLSLAASTKYQLTAGGTSYIFTTTPNTKNTAGTTNKTATKMYLVGATSQGANPQTYSNSGCYIGTDNRLYSGGEKVLTTSQATGMVWTRLAESSSWESDKANWQPYEEYIKYDYLVFMVGNVYYTSQVWVKTSKIDDDGSLNISWQFINEPTSSQVTLNFGYLRWNTLYIPGHVHGGDLEDCNTPGYTANVTLKAATPTYSRNTISSYSSHVSEVYGVKQA